MKLKLKTLKLQEMVSKAVKGASNNKMIPITGLISIKLQDSVLTLTTTDASNTLEVIASGVEGDNFEVVVQADVFSKLTAKTTSESISLTLKDSSLEFKGNGTYNIELPLNEEGKPIKFPQYKFNATDKPKLPIKLTTIKTMLSINKAALANNLDIPCLTGYYVGDGITTTDTYKVCKTAIAVFSNPVLLPADMVDLLALMEDETIEVMQDGKKMLFVSKAVVVYGECMDEIEDYPIDAINDYVSTEFESKCTLPKTALMNVLDRIMLFVTTYDKNGVYLTFTTEGIICSSKKSNGTELIPFSSSENFKPFSCCVDVELFRTQVSAQSGEVVELWYGIDTAIKMVSGTTTQIVALSEDDRVVANGESNS